MYVAVSAVFLILLCPGRISVVGSLDLGALLLLLH